MAYPQPERRFDSRYAVDTEACLVMVNKGSQLRARMVELSVEGCRVRADRQHALGDAAGIEVMFQLNGIAFRLGGTMQWVDAQQTAGIRFNAMAPRRREALEEVLAELEAERQAARSADAGPAVESDAAALVPTVIAMPHRTGELGPSRAPETERCSADRTSPGPVAIFNGCGTPAEAKSGLLAGPPRARERRSEIRHAVDTSATVHFIDVRAQISGRILDLSMSGCRLRTLERFPVGIYRRVETEFKADGLPFRLGGVVQALHDRFTVGIRFLDLSLRKRDQLQQLMDEMAETQTKEPIGPEVPIS